MGLSHNKSQRLKEKADKLISKRNDTKTEVKDFSSYSKKEFHLENSTVADSHKEIPLCALPATDDLTFLEPYECDLVEQAWRKVKASKIPNPPVVLELDSKGTSVIHKVDIYTWLNTQLANQSVKISKVRYGNTVIILPYTLSMKEIKRIWPKRPGLTMMEAAQKIMNLIQ